jgi:hypothetical protein
MVYNAEAQKRYNQKNKDKIKEYQKKYYKSHPNSPTKLLYYKNYYAKHKDKMLRQMQEYTKKNHKDILEYISKWRKENPNKVKGYYKNNREKHNASMREYYIKNKDKHHARIEARRIPIPEGYLCQKCNIDPAIERHHPDYSKPLEINLLCRKCHKIVDLNRNIYIPLYIDIDTMKKYKPICITLPIELIEKFERYCKENAVAKSKLIALLLEKHINPAVSNIKTA